MNRIVGPKPSSRLCHQGSPLSSGWALTTTRFSSSRRESALLFANAGISVRNLVVGFESWKRTFLVNVPWIAVPFRRDLVDVARPNLVEEERAVRNANAGRRPASRASRSRS